MELSEQNRSVLLEVARDAIRRELSPAHDVPRSPSSDPQDPQDPQLLQLGGCFVSLHETGTHRLRGCVGRLDATQPIWLAVQQAAQSALDDPRFFDEQVTLEELGR